MIPEFGQSPISLELDLDSYEGSWTHVAGFRGQSGWLLIARAVIQSEHDLLSADLVAACDEHENPIPAWRAAHLTQCGWDRLDHCCEEPPEILDDLLCEEEGAFYARWQRQMNSGLAALYDRAQRDIEAMEARASARIRALDFQIAELRRRRRMVEASEDARATIAAIIAELEVEQDQVTTQLAHRRSALRRQADAAEEALWQRTDVLIEIEPLRLVRWRTKSEASAVRFLSPEQPGSGGISLLGSHRNDLRAVAQRRAKEALEAARRAEAARAATLEKQAAADASKASSQPTQTIKPTMTGRSDLPKASPALRKLAAAAAQPAPIIVIASPPLLPIATKAAQQPAQGKLVIERDMLVGMLDAVEARGQRLFSGSPKYRRNVEQRAELARQIAALDAKIAGIPARQALPIISLTEDQPNAWPMDRVDMLRQLWSQGMSAADIGRAIGGVSRNAVIGKAKRLGLPMQAKADMGGRQSAENELAAKL